MSRTKKLTAIATTSAAAAALAVAATATPALAWTSGPFTATLSGTMVIDAGVSASCTDSTLSGTVAADGTLSITSASVSGCGVTVTPKGLPWSGSLNGGVATINGFQMEAIGCRYSGNLTGSYTGTSFPVTATYTKQKVNKTSGLFCPSSATVTATYVYTQP